MFGQMGAKGHKHLSMGAFDEQKAPVVRGSMAGFFHTQISWVSKALATPLTLPKQKPWAQWRTDMCRIDPGVDAPYPWP